MLITTTESLVSALNRRVDVVVIVVAFTSAVRIAITAPTVAFLSNVVHVVGVVARRVELFERVITDVVYAAIECACDVIVAVAIVIFGYAYQIDTLVRATVDKQTARTIAIFATRFVSWQLTYRANTVSTAALSNARRTGGVWCAVFLSIARSLDAEAVDHSCIYANVFGHTVDWRCRLQRDVNRQAEKTNRMRLAAVLGDRQIGIDVDNARKTGNCVDIELKRLDVAGHRKQIRMVVDDLKRHRLRFESRHNDCICRRERRVELHSNDGGCVRVAADIDPDVKLFTATNECDSVVALDLERHSLASHAVLSGVDASNTQTQ